MGFLIGRFFCAKISEIPCVFLVLISPFLAEVENFISYYIDNQLFERNKMKGNKMANGFWNFFKKVNKLERDVNDKNSDNYINNNPTEEQLKDNKNGNIAILLSVVASILLIVTFAIIVRIFSNNVGLGLLSIVLLLIPGYLQMNAVKKAKRQLNINGKGKIKFLLVKFVFPIISAIVSIVLIFYLTGTYLK